MENGFCLKLCHLLGIHPDHAMNKMRVTLINMLTTCCLLLASLKFYLDKNLESLETCNGLIIMLVGYLALVFNRKTIKQILDSMRHFWNINVADTQVTQYTQYFKTVEKIYKMVIIFGFLTHVMRPFISKGASIFSCYVPPHIPFPLFCGVELYYLIFVVTSYVCPNIFVCFLIISLVVQFRLVNLKIKDLNHMEVENDRDLRMYKEKLKFIIQHQQFLMRCVDDLNKLLSVPIALLMGTSVMMMCISMYVIAIQEVSVSNESRLVVSNFALIAEFFLVYGLPAQLLMDEAEETANVIYYQCKWYLPSLKPLRKDFLIIICRSQKGVYIRAGNYHVVNNRTVLLMLKTAYSLFTFLQNVT